MAKGLALTIGLNALRQTRPLEHSGQPRDSSSAEAERILYFTLMSAIDAGLLRTMEDTFSSCATRASRLGRWALSGWSGRRGCSSVRRVDRGGRMFCAVSLFFAGLSGAWWLP